MTKENKSIWAVQDIWGGGIELFSTREKTIEYCNKEFNIGSDNFLYVINDEWMHIHNDPEEIDDDELPEPEGVAATVRKIDVGETSRKQWYTYYDARHNVDSLIFATRKEGLAQLSEFEDEFGTGLEFEYDRNGVYGYTTNIFSFEGKKYVEKDYVVMLEKKTVDNAVLTRKQL